MTHLLFSNNAQTVLSGPITNVATTCTLQTGAGILFPSPASGQGFLMTFIDAATGVLNEIVLCTARSGDTCTIVRAQEGTTALAWSAGDTAAQLVTKGTMQSFVQTATLRPSFTVVMATAQSIPASTATTLTWGIELFDDTGNISGSTFTVPITGKYQFAAYVHGSQSSAAQRNVEIYVNGSATRRVQEVGAGPGAITIGGSTGVMELTAGDLVTVKYFSTLADTINTTSYLTYFAGNMIV